MDAQLNFVERCILILHLKKKLGKDKCSINATISGFISQVLQKN